MFNNVLKQSLGSKSKIRSCTLILSTHYYSASGTKVDHPFFRHSEKQTESPVAGTVVNGLSYFKCFFSYSYLCHYINKFVGEIPIWLTGNLIRNGPGIQHIGHTSYVHL